MKDELENLGFLLKRNFFQIPLVITIYFLTLIFLNTHSLMDETKKDLIQFIFSDLLITVSIIIPIIIGLVIHYQKEYLLNLEEIILELKFFLFGSLSLVIWSFYLYFFEIYLFLDIYWIALIISSLFYVLIEFTFLLGKFVNYLSPEKVFLNLIKKMDLENSSEFIKKIILNENLNLLKLILKIIDKNSKNNNSKKTLIFYSNLYSNVIEEILFNKKFRYLNNILISQLNFFKFILNNEINNFEIDFISEMLNKSLNPKLYIEIKDIDDFNLKYNYKIKLHEIYHIGIQYREIRENFIIPFTERFFQYITEYKYFKSNELIWDLINWSELYLREDIGWVHNYNKVINYEFLSCDLKFNFENESSVDTSLIRTYSENFNKIFNSYGTDPFYDGDFDKILKINLQFLNNLYLKKLEFDFSYYMDLYKSLFLKLKEINKLNCLFGTISYIKFFELIFFYLENFESHIYYKKFTGENNLNELLEVYDLLPLEIRKEYVFKIIGISLENSEKINNESLNIIVNNFISKLNKYVDKKNLKKIISDFEKNKK